VADFDAALNVDSVTFMQRGVSTGALDTVPDSGTYDGNTVQVEATISNAGTTALTTGVSFGRATSVAATGTTPLAAEGAAASPIVTVPAGGTATADFQWDTQGDAWTDSSQPDTDHLIRVTTDLTPGYGQETIAVRPKPVILVHGLNADYTTWAAYPAFLTSVNPDWEAYAVGDGQAPGVMNTSPVHTPGSGVGNTILGNAGQEAQYIQGVRDKTGAWHVDIVAHSMGGLISRQYIDSLMPGPTPDGRPVVSHLMMLGTPNEGSPCADMLSLVEGSFVAIPTLQLSATYLKVFNSQVTNRNGVPFSILAGNIGLPTCGGPDGDSVVPEFSALWTIADRTVVPGLLHTDMTASRLAFDGWVAPHLAIGPDGASAPTTLDPEVRADVTPRLAELRPASAGRNAKPKKPKKPKKGKTHCVTANGGLASVTGTARFTATTAGVNRRFTVLSASRLVLSVFAPDSAITVTDPAGKAVQHISAATVRKDGSLFDTYTTKHPALGSWKLEAQSVGGRQPAAYVLLEPGAASTLTATLGIARQTVTHVAATLRTRGRGQPGAHVTALLTLPSGKHRTIDLHAVKRHAGEYTANVQVPLTKGSLPLQAVVHATNRNETMTALATGAGGCTTTS
jgi:large repetitive protein